MASFIHLKESNRFYQKFDSAGVILQSLDVLDFSVIHLSAFERYNAVLMQFFDRDGAVVLLLVSINSLC